MTAAEVVFSLNDERVEGSYCEKRGQPYDNSAIVHLMFMSTIFFSSFRCDVTW